MAHASAALVMAPPPRGSMEEHPPLLDVDYDPPLSPVEEPAGVVLPDEGQPGDLDSTDHDTHVTWHSALWLLLTRIGLALALQTSVQVISNEIWIAEVALMQLQTATCDWFHKENVECLTITASDESDRASNANTLEDCEITLSNVIDRFTATFPAYPPTPEELEFIAAKNDVWNRALRPVLSLCLSQLVHIHCPRAFMVVPLITHPLRVVSIRLVHSDLARETPSKLWDLLILSFKGKDGSNLFSGLLPRFFSFLIMERIRKMRIEERIRRFFRSLRQRRHRGFYAEQVISERCINSL